MKGEDETPKDFALPLFQGCLATMDALNLARCHSPSRGRWQTSTMLLVGLDMTTTVSPKEYQEDRAKIDRLDEAFGVEGPVGGDLPGRRNRAFSFRFSREALLQASRSTFAHQHHSAIMERSNLSQSEKRLYIIARLVRTLDGIVAMGRTAMTGRTVDNPHRHDHLRRVPSAGANRGDH